jgi:Cu-Zn family superoxide dismutase
MTTNAIKAIAVFTDQIKGTVKFIEDLHNKKVKIELNLIGLKPNSLHGFHVHEAGDLTDKCTSMCAHFNPYGLTHGCPGMKNRHVGDLGNIHTNNKGEAKYSFYDDVIKLRGIKANIFG